MTGGWKCDLPDEKFQGSAGILQFLQISLNFNWFILCNGLTYHNLKNTHIYVSCVFREDIACTHAFSLAVLKPWHPPLPSLVLRALSVSGFDTALYLIIDTFQLLTQRRLTWLPCSFWITQDLFSRLRMSLPFYRKRWLTDVIVFESVCFICAGAYVCLYMCMFIHASV